MAIKTINGCKLYDNGETNEIVCPVCNRNTQIKLIKNINMSIVPIILEKQLTEYFAVCPNCASTFSISENYIRERNNKTTCSLTPSDLTLISKGNIE